jgi:hypothetical protein
MSEQANETGQESGQGATGTGQEPTGQQGAQQGQGTGQESGNGQQGSDQRGSGADFDLSKIQDPNLRAYLEHQQKATAEARREAATYRTQLREVQANLTQQQQANETAEQKAQREQVERDERTQRLEQENRDLKVGAVVRSAAATAKAFSADTVWAMIKDQVTTDDQGKPTNVEALIADLKRDHAYVFQRARSTAVAGAGGTGPALTMNDRIRAGVRRGPSQED